jgi:hypothetical protein
MDPFHTGKLVLFQVSYRNSWYWFEMLPFVLLGCAGGVLTPLRLQPPVPLTRAQGCWARCSSSSTSA